jgi:cytidyltransferase-like protein
MSIHHPEDQKVITFGQAQELIRQARAKGLVTVLAHGVFDVIHIGHTTFLKEAKRAGDLLFLCLERDESVRMNKGSARPFNPLEERLQLMADLQSVDYVFAFEDVAPYGPAGTAFYNTCLERLRPNKLALALGVQPALVRGMWREYSTTKLLAHIHNQN